MKTDRRAQLIEQYRDGHRAVTEALAGIEEEELDRADGDEWTPREIAHHLADSEMMGAIRLRRILAEDEPVIAGYDEKRFAKTLTRRRPIGPSIEAMRWARESSLQIIERLTEAEWGREARHEELGPYSLDRWLEVYAAHAHDHAAQITRARGR
jgi:hypothetical protein